MEATQAGALRVMNFDGKEISAFVFYFDGKIQLEVQCGWLEHASESSAYLIDTTRLEIGDAPKRAKVENLERKDNFYIRDAEHYRRNEKRYKLYLHVQVDDLGEYLTYESEQSKTFYRAYLVPLAATLRGNGSTPSVRVVQFARNERTECGERVDALIKEFKERTNQVLPDHIAVHLLKHFDITPKAVTEDV